MTVLDLFDLSNKVAIVTGAARGLGRQSALALAEAGGDVLPLWLCFVFVVAFAGLSMMMAYSAFRKSVK